MLLALFLAALPAEVETVAEDWADFLLVGRQLASDYLGITWPDDTLATELPERLATKEVHHTN